MRDHKRTVAIAARDVPTPAKASSYPEPFARRVGEREKKKLGEHFALKNFGVNLTRLGPGGQSALMHDFSTPSERAWYFCGRCATHCI